MKRWTILFAVAVVSVFAPTTFASEAWPIAAYQPFSLPNGIALSPVSYIGHYSAVEAVVMTCWADRIWHPEEGRAYQENAAFAAGIKVSLEMDDWSPDSTLRAELDLTRVPSIRDENGWHDTTLVAATVECMKANAGQYAPRVHFLAIKIKGPRKFARYGGVFNVRGYKRGPKVRQFP